VERSLAPDRGGYLTSAAAEFRSFPALELASASLVPPMARTVIRTPRFTAWVVTMDCVRPSGSPVSVL
jgi:hypothetical protein